MSRWHKRDDKFCWTDESSGITVTLSSDDNGSMGLSECFRNFNLKKECENNSVNIADVVVLEWREIWVQVEGGEVSEVYFGSDQAQKHRNEWLFTFRNYLGKSRICVQLADSRKIFTDPIEVVSLKTLDKSSPIFYPKLLRALVDELVRYLVTLPFDWSAPTEFPTEERVQLPAPIFVLHVLAQHADTIRFALQTVLHNPHRQLVMEERWVKLDEVSSVDADTILMMLHHPEHLRPYQGTALATLANQLISRRGQKFVPERVFERRVAETLDTPENRFIKCFMDTVLFWCDELKHQGYWQKASSHAPQLDDLSNFVRFARADPLFADVGEMKIFPASSQVLLKRDGYRECLQIYRLLHLARVPVFDRVQDAIDNRRIDQLYEFWCFFKLAEELANGEAFSIKPTLQSTAGGLEWGLEAHLPDSSMLVYNKQFGHNKGSYSIPLRPDFSFFAMAKVTPNENKITVGKASTPTIVFDAKFRFDEKDIEQLSIAMLEREMDDATQRGDIERLVKSADICKMHTYRDALQCRAAVVLYPGTKSIFFHTSDERREGENVTADKIAKENDWHGIGAISFGLQSNRQSKIV